VLHGLGRALPKGESVFVPYNCDVVIGEPIVFIEDAKEYIDSVSSALTSLLDACITRQKIVVDK
jgi:hypothetical protein